MIISQIVCLAKRIGISERTLQRRFQSSLSKLIKDKSFPLTDIAYDSGYFDQSHFILHFKVFTKQKPFSFREKN